LVIGGTRYLMSSGSVEKIKSARSQIASAFWGLAILLSSVIILQAINPSIAVFNLPQLQNIPQVDPSKSAPPPGDIFVSKISTEIPFGRIIEDKILQVKIPEDEKNQQNQSSQSGLGNIGGLLGGLGGQNQNSQQKPRMERIQKIAENFFELSKKLLKKSDQGGGGGGQDEGQVPELKKLTQRCECGQSQPCCENENPGPGCKDNSCTTKPGCTCDPCKSVRDDIQKREKENLDVLYKGVQLQNSSSGGSSGSSGNSLSGGNDQEKTSIRKEQEKAKEEIRLLRAELGKLERVETFMFECPLAGLTNLANYLELNDSFNQKKWTYSTVNFWDAIKVKEDWASFYCSVSGTLWEPKPLSVSDLPENLSFLSSDKGQQSSQFGSDQASTSCTKEIPIGEIFDRTGRVGYKLIERMEKLISLGEELIKAVDDLHILVSQCSSAGPSSDPQRQGCMSICHKTFFTFIKECTGKPCPDQAIEKKVKDIKDIIYGIPNDDNDSSSGSSANAKIIFSQLASLSWPIINDVSTFQLAQLQPSDFYNGGNISDIFSNPSSISDILNPSGQKSTIPWSNPKYGGSSFSPDDGKSISTNGKKKEKEGIKDVVERKLKDKDQDKEDPESREQVGIKPIIKDVVPKILEDLKLVIRDRLRECSSVTAQPVQLYDCPTATGSIAPDGRIIKDCCYDQDYYKECLSVCYLEKGDEKYAPCMYNCLKKQEQKYNLPNLRFSYHKVNFYCCIMKQ